jgi:dihydroorotate dehydrogenase electron transfer subunit
LGGLEANDSLCGAVFSAVQCTARVVEQERMATDTYRLRLHCPAVARQITPGQFFMIRLPGTDDPLLGRPFALYDVYEEDGRKAGLDFGYVVVGKLTSAMTDWKPGDRVEIWGPLGNGFPLPTAEHLLLVAGGIGQTPFLAVAREALGLRQYGTPPRQPAQSVKRVTLCYGTRSAEYLAGLDDFRMDGLAMMISTDDGTQGRHGLVTKLLVDALNGADAPQQVYCCGPEPMMKAVQEICAAHKIDCWLSLESPMACGFGVCFSCVARIRLDDGSWDYRRTCVEGPVFSGERLMF